MAPLGRPLVLAFLSFLAGLLGGLRVGIDPLPLAGLAGLAVVLSLGTARTAVRRDERWGWSALLIGFALLGGAAGGGARQAAAGDCRGWLADRAELQVRAVLAANTLPTDQAADRPLLPAYASRVQWDGKPLAGCGGALRIRLPELREPIAAGSVLEVHGAWTRLAPPVVPSAWPRDPRYAGYLLADRIAVVQPPDLGLHPLLTLRGRAESRLQRLFPHFAALTEALLLGRRERVDPALRERFARAGLAHLLAISGMHVGIIAGILLLAGRLLRRLQRVPRRAPTYLAIGGLACYLLVIGAPPSAVRAGVMFSLALLGLLLQRPYAALPVVAAAALAMLVHRPLTVLEPGFQLSFAGVLGILAGNALAYRRLPPAWRHEGWRPYLAGSLLASLAAFIATAPVVAWHFGLIAPVAIGANLVAVPLMGLGLSAIVAAALTDLLLPSLGRLLANGAEAFLFALDAFASWAARVPYGHLVVARPRMGAWAVAVLGVLLALDLTRKLAHPLRALAATTAALATLVVGPALAGAVGLGRGALELHFLDVGQGDAIAIRTPADRWVLVDAGPADARFDAGERRVLPFLRARGARRLEAMILTHPHQDHIGGAAAVLRALPVGVLIEPGHVTGSPTYLEVLRAAEARGVAWHAARSGRVLELDGVRLEFLWPDPETLDGARDANEISAVTRIRFGRFAALLTGDAHSEQEHVLVRRHGGDLRAQVLKAGHHGSYTSTSPLFLDTVRPDLVVISAGRRNRFGHPAPEVMHDLAVRGVRVSRTDRDGTISIVVRDAGTGAWEWSQP